jgi:hypothetical protein
LATFPVTFAHPADAFVASHSSVGLIERVAAGAVGLGALLFASPPRTYSALDVDGMRHLLDVRGASLIGDHLDAPAVSTEVVCL